MSVTHTKGLARDCSLSRKRQQSLLHVMQRMLLLQKQLAYSISLPYIMFTRARTHVQNGDYLGFSIKVCYN
jgi:hypothetical protein